MQHLWFWSRGREYVLSFNHQRERKDWCCYGYIGASNSAFPKDYSKYSVEHIFFPALGKTFNKNPLLPQVQWKSVSLHGKQMLLRAEKLDNWNITTEHSKKQNKKQNSNAFLWKPVLKHLPYNSVAFYDFQIIFFYLWIQSLN